MTRPDKRRGELSTVGPSFTPVLHFLWNFRYLREMQKIYCFKSITYKNA